ncbi:cell division protein FtsZ [Persephonella sp.]
MEKKNNQPLIKIIGIGGGGSNIVSYMSDKIKDVEFVIVDTNIRSLEKHAVDNKIQLGASITSGLGAGSKPEVGKKAVEESIEDVKTFLEDTDILFAISGLGGGTGTGALPEITKIAKEMGILTTGIITKPFSFEGTIRKSIAEEGLKKLKETVDSYIVIDNNKISEMAKNKLTFIEAFKLVDEFLLKVIKGITDLIYIPAFINLDFADLKTTMEQSGKAVIGIGIGKGENKINDVILSALSSPLLEENDISKAKNIMLNIDVSPDVSYEDVSEVVNQIKEKVHKDSHIIFGAMINENLENEMKLTLIATRFAEYENENKKEKDLSKQVREVIYEEKFSIYDYLDIPAYERIRLNKRKT